MDKIATHDSATGEKCKGLLSYLVWIFSVTQGKTIKEQYDAGCRYFDLRVKLDKHNVWRCAHGLWTAKPTFMDILNEINSFGEPCYVDITYEIRLTDEEKEKFLELVDSVNETYKNILICSVNLKKPTWTNVRNYHSVPLRGEFVHLDGSSWHTYIPLPWLWKKIYYDEPKFNEDYYTMVDFL